MENEIVGIDDVGNFNTPIDNINGEVVNLIFTGIDCSGSMDSFANDMKISLNEFKTALQNSKEKDDMLIARADFASNIDIGGYKKIDDYDISYQANGSTKLYDVIVDGAKKLTDYMDYLKNQGVRVKVVFSIFSDGEDTASVNRENEAIKAIEILNNKEITTAYIAFGSAAQSVASRLKFKNILNVLSSASELRKAFDVLSKSVISSSKSIINNTNNFFTI